MPHIPVPDWFQDYSANDAGQVDSDMGSSGDEYTKPPALPLGTDLSIGDTDAIDDEYDTTGLISQLSGDIDDSEELRASAQNLIDRKVRNSAHTLRQKVKYLEPNIPTENHPKGQDPRCLIREFLVFAPLASSREFRLTLDTTTSASVG